MYNKNRDKTHEANFPAHAPNSTPQGHFGTSSSSPFSVYLSLYVLNV